ncbi:MAG: discoidin domain-containing protein [Firmicutes bacterium]|nr:discoidin domain-containing protein [Bacillota bacterium]
MILSISVIGADRQVKARASADGHVSLVYPLPYEPGDAVCLHGSGAGFVTAQMEDGLAPAFGFLRSEFRLPIPFGRERDGYSPGCFSGGPHLLWARAAGAKEIGNYRNLALNPLDHHHNSGFYPHAEANVETRGESAFAARNAIDGNCASAGHGLWPYESWGIDRREDAEIRVDFGREVRIDRLVITLRADFPHDNWWKTAAVTFSNGFAFHPGFVRTGAPQAFLIEPQQTAWLRMSGMVKDPEDPSPFPALAQLEAWGYDMV